MNEFIAVELPDGSTTEIKVNRRAELQRQINEAHANIAATARAHAAALAAAQEADERLNEAIRAFHLLRGALNELG